MLALFLSSSSPRGSGTTPALAPRHLPIILPGDRHHHSVRPANPLDQGLSSSQRGPEVSVLRHRHYDCPVPYRRLDDPAKLRRLLEAVLLLEGDLTLAELLHHFVEEACSMAGARYGALGVLDDSKTKVADFVAVGLDEKTVRAIGDRPAGKGVLGLLISDPRPLRIADLREHPGRYGFPPNHPEMSSFLGVPVAAHGEVYGNLYLTEKIGAPAFTEDDEVMVVALSQAAGIAIENARLHRQVREMAVYDDRDRIARDLHDAVIQRLFAIGLSLQGISRLVTTPPIAERLSRAVADIDETIRQIRSSIFALSSGRDPGSARSRILDLVRELSPVLGFEARVTFEGALDSTLTETMVEHLLFVLREGLTNVGRHARATGAVVSVGVDDGDCVLTVTDNGAGFDPAAITAGLGLHNLAQRAEKLGGRFEVRSSEHGTTIEWRAPAGLR